MKALVIIPTYNERENVEAITSAVLAATADHVHVLVCDDSSPDGTGAIVTALMTTKPRLKLLTRKEKQGLGRAYIAAFKWGLENGYDVLVEMDADFSHRPEDLVKILKAVETADFAMGSRWVPGGSTINWGLGRKIISKGGSLYTRLILGYRVADYTGGFNAYTRRVLEKIGLDKIQSNGYSFQIELKYRALKAGFKGVEVPIVFEDRRVGQSKMSSKIVFEALGRVWGMRFG
jgi:dolichol-phosphate mannosyltransferase